MSWAGNIIKLARAETGLSQRELARRAGTSQATLSAYESGNKSPSLDTLARIIRSSGLDLRISLAPADNHDQWMQSYEASLPKGTQRARRRRDLDVINRARRERGLAPVKAADLR